MTTFSTLIRSTLWVAAASFAFVAPAFAGYTYEFSEDGGAGSAVAMTILVEGESIRMKDIDGGDGEMIYDASKDALIMVEHRRKTYMTLDKEMVEGIARQLNSAMAEMEAQLAQVPPAQRKMMEQMMKGRMPQMVAAAMPEITFQRSGEMETVSGIPAERVVRNTDGAKTGELWIASWDELEGGAAIQGAFLKMSALFKDISESLSQGPMGAMFSAIGEQGAFKELAQLEGFPVKTIDFAANGSIASELILTSVSETTFEKNTFKAPKGYKKQKMEF